MDVYHKILRKYWGYPAFRPLQEDIIHSVCAGRDTLGLMPTGGGKSVTFQVPALAMEGICLVITPLIALMRDQVDNLRRVGIKATAVYSGMGRQEIVAELENCVSGQYKFLYVSPERLATGLFREKLQAILSPKKLRRCEVCGTGILARSGRTKYCPACAKEVHRQQKAKSARKRRSSVDNLGAKSP